MNKLYISDIPDIPIEGGIVGFDNTPIFAEGGMMPENLVGGFGEEATIEIKMKKKAIEKIVRKIKREFMGSNNWRKLHGLPMYRKVRK